MKKLLNLASSEKLNVSSFRWDHDSVCLEPREVVDDYDPLNEVERLGVDILPFYYY